jgi:imidazolonepropionase-like amidohydrolase
MVFGSCPRVRRFATTLGFGVEPLRGSPSLSKGAPWKIASLARWYSPAEILTMATSTNAELLELSGKRNPYSGQLGVVEEGALADLLLVDGNPLDDVALLADPEKNFVVIMKDGAIVKNKFD